MSCKKRRFQTRSAAQKFKKGVNRIFWKHSSVYRCPKPECFNSFHLTTQNRGLRAFMRGKKKPETDSGTIQVE